MEDMDTKNSMDLAQITTNPASSSQLEDIEESLRSRMEKAEGDEETVDQALANFKPPGPEAEASGPRENHAA